MNQETLVINGVQVLPCEEIDRMIREARQDKVFLDELARAELTG